MNTIKHVIYIDFVVSVFRIDKTFIRKRRGYFVEAHAYGLYKILNELKVDISMSLQLLIFSEKAFRITSVTFLKSALKENYRISPHVVVHSSIWRCKGRRSFNSIGRSLCYTGRASHPDNSILL